MYKIYLNDNLLIIDNPSVMYTNKEIIGENLTVGKIGKTKLLQKLQNTKLSLLLCGEPDIMINEISSLFTTIHAAGGVVRNVNGEILMIHRLGKWDLPKGKMEKGESTEECAVREVEEECGISGVKLENYITRTHHLYQINEEWIIKLTDWYAMKYEGNETLLPQTEENIAAVEWVAEKRIDTHVDNTYPTIIDVLDMAGIKTDSNE